MRDLFFSRIKNRVTVFVFLLHDFQRLLNHVIHKNSKISEMSCSLIIDLKYEIVSIMIFN